MKTQSFILILFGISLMLSCNNEIEVEPWQEPLLDEFYLSHYEDKDGNAMHAKPDSLPQDIMLVFRYTGELSGHISSFELGDQSSYTATEDGKFSMSLAIPYLPVCCEWDEKFLDLHKNVTSFYAGGNILKLYYDNGNKAMVFNH